LLDLYFDVDNEIGTKNLLFAPRMMGSTDAGIFHEAGMSIDVYRFEPYLLREC
jgi:hypothetical protein